MSTTQGWISCIMHLNLWNTENTISSTLFTPLKKPKNRKKYKKTHLSALLFYIYEVNQERATSILNKPEEINNRLWPFCCVHREGQLEGHLSRSVCDEAPNIDKHWYTCLPASPSPHTINQPIINENQKRLKMEHLWHSYVSTKHLHKTKWSGKVHACRGKGVCRGEEKEKKSRVWFFFFFLVNEHISGEDVRCGEGL